MVIYTKKAPNFGGLWEATVKSTKHHLNAVTKGCALTFEVLTTILSQIEVVLNSRPLVPLTLPEDTGLEALTPAHFLIGQSLTSLPEQDFSLGKTLIKKWNLCQKMIQNFWRRWSSEYLITINRHQKWAKPQRSMKIGDLVLLKDQTTFTNKWPLARVVQIYPDNDGYVRVAIVRTTKGEYRRPTSKMVLLLPEEEEVAPLGSPSGGSMSGQNIILTRCERLR